MLSTIAKVTTIDIFKLEPGNLAEAEGYQLKDLHEVADSYDPKLSEAFLTIGHMADKQFVLGFSPADDVPSYGKVINLFVDGNTLFADVEPIAEAVDWIRRGLYNHRSAGIYKPDNIHNPTPGKRYLRHIALLGASPPKIKGLTPLNELFAERTYNEEENGLETFVMPVTKTKTDLFEEETNASSDAELEEALETDATTSPDDASTFLNENASSFIAALLTADDENGYAGEITRFEPEPSEENNWLMVSEDKFAGNFVDESLGEPEVFAFTAEKQDNNWTVSFQPAKEAENKNSEAEPEGDTFAEMLPAMQTAMQTLTEEKEKEAYIARLEQQLIGQQLVINKFEEADAMQYVNGIYDNGEMDEAYMPRGKLVQLYLCISRPDYKPETDCYSEGESNLDVFKQLVTMLGRQNNQLTYGEVQADETDIDTFGGVKPVETFGGLANKNIALSERGMSEYIAITDFAKQNAMDISTPIGFSKAHKAYYASMP